MSQFTEQNTLFMREYLPRIRCAILAGQLEERGLRAAIYWHPLATLSNLFLLTSVETKL
jgi:hypothetical protein